MLPTTNKERVIINGSQEFLRNNDWFNFTNPKLIDFKSNSNMKITTHIHKHQGVEKSLPQDTWALNQRFDQTLTSPNLNPIEKWLPRANTHETQAPMAKKIMDLRWIHKGFECRWWIWVREGEKFERERKRAGSYGARENVIFSLPQSTYTTNYTTHPST